MKKLGLIIPLNLTMVVLYTTLINVEIGQQGRSPGWEDIMIPLAFIVFLHGFACLCIALVQFARKKDDSGRTWMLSCGLIYLIGFTLCLGSGVQLT